MYFGFFLSLTGSGFQTLSRSPLPKYWSSIPPRQLSYQKNSCMRQKMENCVNYHDGTSGCNLGQPQFVFNHQTQYIPSTTFMFHFLSKEELLFKKLNQPLFFFFFFLIKDHKIYYFLRLHGVYIYNWLMWEFINFYFCFKRLFDRFIIRIASNAVFLKIFLSNE